MTGELANNADAQLSSGTALLESRNDADMARYQTARLNLADRANAQSASYAADAVALTLRRNRQVVNLQGSTNAALAAGMARGESMYAAGLRNRAPVGPVLISSEQANSYIKFMQDGQAQHAQYYTSLNGGQKFLYNAGANLVGGLINGGQALGDATALLGIQGGYAFSSAWSNVGDTLSYVAHNPVDALIVNPATAAYNRYSSIYNTDGFGAAAGTLTGDLLSGVPFASIGAVGPVRITSAVTPSYKASIDTAYHVTTKEGAAQNILNGIDPAFFNPKSRFGRAFYIADKPTTSLAELAHHGANPIDAIRYDFNVSQANILDFTNPDVANAWNYNGGSISSVTRQIGIDARQQGYNVIRYYSERAPGGINNAVLDNFNELLIPQMISPAKP
jgi:hypothetical protein